MGSPPCEWGRGKYDEDENETTITHDFLVKQVEVTQAEWTAEGLPNPSGSFPSGPEHDCLAPDCPVGKVNWYEALAYANRLSVKAGLPECYALEGCTGALGAGLQCSGASSTTASAYECKGIRIPTEAEWEYATRAGTRTAYYGGDNQRQAQLFECYPDSVLDPIGWYCANTDAGSNPVGKKAPNPWGLFDVAGNAAEYVFDRFSGVGYGTAPRTDPQAVPKGDDLAVARGGISWSYAPLARSANRLQVTRNVGFTSHGIRLVRRAD